MKKIDLGQTINTLANLGVIAGIAFLAVELSQNNDELAAQTRNTMYQLRADLERTLIDNAGGIAEIVVKERRGDALTDLDETRLGALRFHMLRTFGYMIQDDSGRARTQAIFMSMMFTNFGLTRPGTRPKNPQLRPLACPTSYLLDTEGSLV